MLSVRDLLTSPLLVARAQTYAQGTSSNSFYEHGCLPRIRRQITTLHEELITRARLCGSFKAVSSLSGSLLAPSCGSTENVRSYQFLDSLLLTVSDFRSGLWEKHYLVCCSLPFFL